MTVQKLKGDTPWSVHMDCVARRFEPPQRMELRAGEVHVLWTASLIETVKQAQDATLQTLIDPANPAIVPQLSQRLVLERLYHFGNVINSATDVNCSETGSEASACSRWSSPKTIGWGSARCDVQIFQQTRSYAPSSRSGRSHTGQNKGAWCPHPLWPLCRGIVAIRQHCCIKASMTGRA